MRRSNQSILKEISPEYSLEGLMLKLKLQYFGHLMWRANSLEKTLMLGKMKAGGEGDNRGWDGWMASLIQWTRVWVNAGSWWWTGMLGMLQSMGSRLHGTELNIVDSTDEPTLTPHNHPKSIVYIVVLFVSYVLWNWQVYNDMIHHYGIISAEHFSEQELAVFPFAWQSNEAILFYFNPKFWMYNGREYMGNLCFFPSNLL